MITDREPTLEERTKVMRSIRYTAISALIFGVVMLGLGMVALGTHRQTTVAYGYVVLGLAWFSIALRNWRRARRYRSEG